MCDWQPEDTLGGHYLSPFAALGRGALDQHAGQLRLLVTLIHAADDQIKAMLANVRKGSVTILAAA